MRGRRAAVEQTRLRVDERTGAHARHQRPPLAREIAHICCRKPLVRLQRPGVAAREHEQIEVLLSSVPDPRPRAGRADREHR